jgi:hypothetical protein
MSNNSTKTVVAKPYFNLAFEDELTGDDNEQNPKENDTESDSADQATQSNSSNTATSDSEDLTYKERWVNLKRYHDTSIHEARQKIRELEEKLSAASSNSNTPPATEEELEEYLKDNPELARYMEAMMAKKYQGIDPSRIIALEEELEKSRQAAAISQIKSAHPDYVDIVASQKFQDWLEEQTASVQSMVKENGHDAKAFIRALDLYKLDAGITSANGGTSPQKKSKSDASAADAVLTKGASKADVGEIEGRIWTREEIDKLTPQEFEMFEQDIDQAWREGRVR